MPVSELIATAAAVRAIGALGCVWLDGPGPGRMTGSAGAMLAAHENGYTHGRPAPLTDRRLQAMDPAGAPWAALPPTRCLGFIAYPAATIAAPDVIHDTDGDRVVTGDADTRAVTPMTMLQHQAAPERFQGDWKRQRALSDCFGAHLYQPDRSSQADVAPGIRIAIDKRIAGATEVGPHKTSVLPDLRLGGAADIEAILVAVTELAGWVGAPISRSLLALMRQRAMRAGEGS